MTREEIANMIAEIGLPYAYRQFPEDTGQQPPFICFYYASGDDVLADDRHYVCVDELIIELYTDSKDFIHEKIIKTVLTRHDLIHYWDEAYIDSERMNMVTFRTEVVINE